jgi:hypothetical protein
MKSMVDVERVTAVCDKFQLTTQDSCRYIFILQSTKYEYGGNCYRTGCLIYYETLPYLYCFNSYLRSLTRQDSKKNSEHCAFYGLDTEPEPELEP